MKAYLQQHMQGAHMGSWRAACGEVKKWPKQLHKHEDLCKKCAAVELKKNTKLAEIRAKVSGEGGKRKKKKIVKQEHTKGKKNTKH